MKPFVLMLALVSLVVLGCGGEQQASDQPKTSNETQTPPAASDPSSAVSSTSEGAEMTVAGTLGCGHCTYHVGDACSAALKTADGKLYILDVDQDSELFTERLSGNQVVVTGRSHDHEGEAVHFAVGSYELN